jgi:hypothetical protein
VSEFPKLNKKKIYLTLKIKLASTGVPTPLPPVTNPSSSKCDEGWMESPISNYCYLIDSRALDYSVANMV